MCAVCAGLDVDIRSVHPSFPQMSVEDQSPEEVLEKTHRVERGWKRHEPALDGLDAVDEAGDVLGPLLDLGAVKAGALDRDLGVVCENCLPGVREWERTRRETRRRCGRRREFRAAERDLP